MTVEQKREAAKRYAEEEHLTRAGAGASNKRRRLMQVALPLTDWPCVPAALCLVSAIQFAIMSMGLQGPRSAVCTAPKPARLHHVSQL